MIRVLIGRADADLFGRVVDDVRGALFGGGDCPLFVLVPEQMTLLREVSLIEGLGACGLLRAEVLSLSRLARRAGVLEPMDSRGRSMVMAHAVHGLEGELTVYRGMVKKRGFHKMLADQVAELKQAGVTPEALFALSESVGEVQRSRKLRDIAVCFRAYEAERKYDQQDELGEFVRRIPDTAFLRGARIWVEGFETLTQSVNRVLVALSQVCESVTVLLTCDDSEIFAPVNESIGRLARMAGEMPPPYAGEVIIEKVIAPRKQAPDIAHIEKSLFSTQLTQYDGTVENVRVSCAHSPHDEAERVAAEIIHCARERKLRWNDISVVCGSSYGSVILRALNRHGVPAFLDLRWPISLHPAVRYLISALKAVMHGFQREDVIACIKTGFAGLSRDEADLAENFCEKRGLKGFRIRQEWIGEEESLHARFQPRLDALAKRLDKAKTVSDFAAACYLLLEESDVYSQLEAEVKEKQLSNDPEKIEEAAHSAQVWNLIIETLDQMHDLLGDKETTPREALSLLQNGIDAIDIAIIPPSPDQVEIGTVGHLKGEVRALFVAGLSDAMFKDDTTSLLLDEERAATARDLGVYLGPDAQGRACVKQLDAYALLTKPSDYLHISYPMTDITGSPTRPASTLNQIKKALPLRVESPLSLGAARSLIATPEGSFSNFSSAMCDYRDGHPVFDVWWQAASWYMERFPERVNNLLKAMGSDISERRLTQSEASKLYGDSASVSRLELYAKCPFAHFTRYALKPVPLKPWEVQSVDTGTFFHEAVEAFALSVAANKLDWHSITKERCTELMEEARATLEQRYVDTPLMSSARMKALFASLYATASRAVWLLVRQLRKSRFTPRGAELTFGKDGAYKSLPLVLEDGRTVELEGRIDRVDIYSPEEEPDKSYVRIIDYKSGDQSLTLPEIYWGLKLQLLIYLNAATRYIDEGKSLPAGAFYYRVSTPPLSTYEKDEAKIEQAQAKAVRLKGFALDETRVIEAMDNIPPGASSEVLTVRRKKDETFYGTSSLTEAKNFSRLLSHAERTARRLLTEAYSGIIAISPSRLKSISACAYCDYASICRFDPRTCTIRRLDITPAEAWSRMESEGDGG